MKNTWSKNLCGYFKYQRCYQTHLSFHWFGHLQCMDEEKCPRKILNFEVNGSWRNAIKPSKHVAESNPGLGTLNWIVSKKVIIINYWSGDIIIVCEPFLVDKTFSFFHYYKWICEQTYYWICFCERNVQNLMMACLSWKLIPRRIQLC